MNDYIGRPYHLDGMITYYPRGLAGPHYPGQIERFCANGSITVRILCRDKGQTFLVYRTAKPQKIVVRTIPVPFEQRLERKTVPV